MRKLRAPLSICSALALCLSLSVPAALAAGATGTVVTTADELQAALDRGGRVTLGHDIGVQTGTIVNADTEVDLNGYQLTILANQAIYDAALEIGLGQTLTISDSKYSKFAPGHGKLLVNGFHTAISTNGATLIINSGVVEAKGKFGTGIGGMNENGRHDGGTVTINSGIVTATGGKPGTYGGAGIGGMGDGSSSGGSGGTITINGGTVTATGGVYGAGIGSGGRAGGSYNSNLDPAGTIIIRGGTVKANAGSTNASDIGCGANSSDLGNLEITGGTVELARGGIDVGTQSFQSCTITGSAAGELKGSYDAGGTLVTVTGTSSWAAEDVAGAIARNLVPAALQSGYSNATTRQEFCALAVALYETVTGQEITQRKTFVDTTDVNVEKMGALGVVSGVGGGRFNPNGTLTREQAATMLARLSEAAGDPLPTANAAFSDKASISSWAVAQVGQVQAAGIMSGVGNNRFGPTGTYTREQSIVTMLRLFRCMEA